MEVNHNFVVMKPGKVPLTHKQFFSWLGNQLGCSSLDEWYNVSSEEVHRLGGSHILESHYNNSVPLALQSIFPKHKWIFWKFERVPRGFWRDKSNRKEYFDWLGKQLGYKQLDDWYNITKEIIHQQKGNSMIKYCRIHSYISVVSS